MTPDQNALLHKIEWEYSSGQSFRVGDDDLLRWMLNSGWTITPPPDFKMTRFQDFPENQARRDL